MFVTESLHIFETSGCETCLDNFGPRLLAVDDLPDLLPLNNPGAVDLVPGSASFHAPETTHARPSLEFFKFGLVDFNGVLLDLIGRQVVALSIDDCCEGYVIRVLCTLLESENQILIVIDAHVLGEMWAESGNVARKIEFHGAIVCWVV